MRTRIIAVVVAAVLAIVGGLVLADYVRSADARAFRGTELQQVYVVTSAIAAGTEASALATSVALQPVAKAYVVEGAVVDLSALDGLVASDDMVPGEQVLLSRFTSPNEFAANEGSIDVPAGLDELSFAVDAQRVLGGRVLPGDKVAILSSFQGDPAVADDDDETIQILTQVLVTSVAVDSSAIEAAKDVTTLDPDSDKASTSGTVLVTVAVSADDAAKIAFSTSFGTLWLSRVTDDSTPGKQHVTTLEELEQ